jgi:hypothetical protein
LHSRSLSLARAGCPPLDGQAGRKRDVHGREAGTFGVLRPWTNVSCLDAVASLSLRLR